MTAEHQQQILDKIKAKGALKHCIECGVNNFELIGHSSGAAMYLNPDELKPGDLLPHTRSYKMYIVACKSCRRISGFMDD